MKQSVTGKSRVIIRPEDEGENCVEKHIYNRRNSSRTEGIRYITRLEKEYPERLQNIPDPPGGIYVKGKLPEKEVLTVGIVGARMCSEYGRYAAREYARALSAAGVAVISGMAKGVDGISQSETIANGGCTYGVLGCGLNVVYPAQNAEIYEKICERGGLISEFPPDTPPAAKHFPMRNRIISGLSDVLLVIEARQRSGTGITVAKALEQGKDVYAVPGRINDPLSEGCNRLISQGAGIALSPAEFLKNLGIYLENSSKEYDKKINSLEKKEKVVYSVLDLYPRRLEDISTRTGMDFPDVLEILIKLELKGYIREYGKNNYVKLE